MHESDEELRIERLETLIELARVSAAAARRFLQSLTVQLLVNTTTAAVVFGPLLSIAFTKEQTSSVLVILFSVSASNLIGAPVIFFRVRVDGVAQRGTAMSIPFLLTLTQPASIVLQVPGIPAGARTVDVQWRVSAGTAQIRPVAAPDAEHASLIVQEVLP